MPKKLRIALQKSGRLAEGSLSLFDRCGINIQPRKNQLLAQDDAFGLEFLYVRDDDIPGLIVNGDCDLGIIGQNLMEEYSNNFQEEATHLEMIMPLGFSKCRLSIAKPKGQKYESIQDLNGKTIATSYPHILRSFLRNNQINAHIMMMHGSVELAPQIGISNFICDLISSGATLHENGLEECICILSSEAILIHKPSSFDEEKQKLLKRLLLRINGVLKAKQNKYIMLHIDRNKVPLLKTILPGTESPTILELQGTHEKVAVHVVSYEEVFWETIERLKEMGASSILVLPIEKMIY